jgi:hypothetical protein
MGASTEGQRGRKGRRGRSTLDRPEADSVQTPVQLGVLRPTKKKETTGAT